ncbi:hypothetical protein JXL21_14005 [Candidatus Bathyarchaeota archaeon]|nr:hypothetical protein [Candidatus Bathyarchaeota archaeon]
MESRTIERFSTEIKSFNALIIANLVGAALALAFSISLGVTHIVGLFQGGSFEAVTLLYVAVTVAGFAFAINWISNAAELMDGYGDITDSFEKTDPSDDEALTGIIVQSLAFYRDNGEKIGRMTLGSRVTGGLVLLTTIPQVTNLLTPQTGLMTLFTVVGLLCSAGAGLVGLYVPTLFRRYSETWDQRLGLTGEAEERLKGILEG